MRKRPQGIAATDDIDSRIGARLRTLRLARSLSQAVVGKAIGVPSQRIENYESGKSRIAASTLFALANLFDVAPSHFLDSLPGGAAYDTTNPEEDVIAFMKTPECLELIRAVQGISRTRVRRQIMAFLRGISEIEE